MSKCEKIFFLPFTLLALLGVYSAPPCFTTAFLVGWVLATLTSCWEPRGRPTRKKLARLFISSSQVGSVYGKFLPHHWFSATQFSDLSSSIGRRTRGGLAGRATGQSPGGPFQNYYKNYFLNFDN